MGTKDTKSKEYMSDNSRFADLCNFALFDGEAVISESDLLERDSTEVLSILGINQKEVTREQEWDAPVKLSDMFGNVDGRLKRFVPDYEFVYRSRY